MTTETLRDDADTPCVGHMPSICCAALAAAIGLAAVADVRAEEAAKGLTVEALAAALHRVGIESSNWYCGRADHQREHGVEPGDADWTARDEDKHRIESERLFAALTPTPPPPAGCERTHWDGSTLLAERNHYLAGCSCPQRPWCVPHGWAGVEPEHHAICADHEHVATPPPPAATVERCAFVMDGMRCNDTPIQHRAVCGLLHSHSFVCHPFTPTPEPK